MVNHSNFRHRSNRANHPNSQLFHLSKFFIFHFAIRNQMNGQHVLITILVEKKYYLPDNGEAKTG